MRLSKQLTLSFFLVFLFSAYARAQGFLHASNGKIVNGAGNEVLLRGMGLGGWMLQEPYMLQLSGVAVNQGDIKRKITDLIGKEKTAAFYDRWLNNFCQKSDIDSLAAWGFNSIRLPMHYNLFTLPIEQEPVQGKETWLPKGFEMVDSLLSWCKANKIYLFLDLHAAPGGQGNDNAISDRDSTKPSLWQSKANQDKTVALWQKLAERYASEKWIGGYDLINETNWGFENPADKNGCAEPTNAPLRQLLMAITSAIRKVDKNHIIILEANCWANNYKGIFPLWDNNLVVSFHKYWNENTQGSIQQFIDIRSKYNVPIWMGESGENSNAWFRSAIALLESNKIGWAWWPHKKMRMNNPFEIKSNPRYHQLIEYWTGKSSRPSESDAFIGLMQLAEDSKLENTIYHKDVVDAMFRQVERGEALPFANHHIKDQPVIYAVNYDLGPNGTAYFSKDSANYWVSSGKRVNWNSGWVYRNDGVDITSSTDSITNGFQVTNMQPEEWLQYTFYTEEAGSYDIELRTMVQQTAAVKLVINNDVAVNNQELQANEPVSWSTFSIKSIGLKKGANQLRLRVNSGQVSLNYFRFLKQGQAADAAGQ